MCILDRVTKRLSKKYWTPEVPVSVEQNTEILTHALFGIRLLSLLYPTKSQNTEHLATLMLEHWRALIFEVLE